jgi:rfaE bifunctional protein kinase chain/domain
VTADLERLVDIVESFAGRRIAVVGDLVADEFVSGEIARVSREAPVLILRHRETSFVPGGGANAANNLAALGARVAPVGVVGEDPAGRALLDYFRARGVSTAGILRARGWTTPTKTRYLAGWPHTALQQVLRVDREPGAMPEALARRVAARARSAAGRSEGVLISDYGFGAATPALVRQLRAKVKTLDSRYQLLAYAGAGVTAATPNEPELEALYGTPIASDTAKLERLAARTLRRMRLAALVVTRGKDGMALAERRGPVRHIPAWGGEATDVTGAGDTVIAVFTLALAAGANAYEAAVLANYAGGIVVRKRGTATVTRAELLAAIRSEATGAPAAPSAGSPAE